MTISTDIYDPTIMDFSPVRLDELPLYNNCLTSGYNVCDEFTFLRKSARRLIVF
ncbi:MAG: hypothetical protein ABIK93_08450 [candidate division WOR-3 bacterium]